MHHEELRMSHFSCKLPNPILASPIKKKSKELCRGVNIRKETNYVKFHDTRHLSVQGINIKVLKKEVFKNGRYDAENKNKKKHKIHNFFKEKKKKKIPKNFVLN